MKTNKDIKGSHVRGVLRGNGPIAASVAENGTRYMRLDQLCAALSLAVNHDNLTMLETRLKEINVITEETEGEPAVTLIPWRSRKSYGLPESADSVERAPAESRAKRRDGSQSVAYYPLVALGVVECDESESTSTYDGRYDGAVQTIKTALAAMGGTWATLEVKGRMVRGGGGIFIRIE